jgi:protein-S-isoprenylcysteine O-methyltransferase Ste14
MDKAAIRVGNFFFRTRNIAFPIFILVLYALAVPSDTVLGSRRLEHVKDLIALAIALLGLAVRATVIGYAYIKRGGKNKRVYAADLVTEGMFALSRNPLYLGNLLICFGTFLMHGNPYVVVVGTAGYVLVYVCIVRAEEEYLLQKFGDGYRAYCADVPRWIPKLSRFREATQGMDFDIRRVITKDYTTIATTIAVLAVTELYRQLAHSDASSNLPYLAFLAVVVLLCGVATLAVRTVKKRPA